MVLAGAAVAAGSAFATLVVSGFKAADALGDAAERAGVSVESLSRLKFAAEQNDVQFEALATSIKRWQVTLSGAASGEKQAAEALGLIQIKASELKSLRLEDQLERIADQFKRIQDPADRTRVAIELFGRAGEQLVPLLARGGEGIKTLTDEADRLGITLDSNTVQSIDKTDKALKKLKATISSFGSRVAGQIASDIIGPVDDEDLLDRLLKKREALERVTKGSIFGPADNQVKALADLNKQIDEVYSRIFEAARKAATTTDKPLKIPVDTKATDKLLDSLEMVRVGVSRLADPLIEWEAQTRTSVEKVSREFDAFEAKLNQLVAHGVISAAEAAKRQTAKLDEILQPIQISVERLKVPLTAAQEKAKEFTDTLVEGLSNAARASETSGKAILRSLLAAFESKALQAAIEALANSVQRALSGVSTKSTFIGGLLGAFVGHAAGGGSMSGPRIVGEEGPELELGGGGQVVNRRQLAFSMGGGGNISYSPQSVYNIQGSGDPERTAQYVEARIQQNNRKQLEQFGRILQNNGYGALR